MNIVVVATHNTKKAVELHRVLAAAGIEADVRGLDAFPAYPEPIETERANDPVVHLARVVLAAWVPRVHVTAPSLAVGAPRRRGRPVAAPWIPVHARGLPAPAP